MHHRYGYVLSCTICMMRSCLANICISVLESWTNRGSSLQVNLVIDLWFMFATLDLLGAISTVGMEESHKSSVHI